MKSVAVLASRVRFEEKQIFAALEKRTVRYAHLDTRRLAAGLSGGGDGSGELARGGLPSAGLISAGLIGAGLIGAGLISAGLIGAGQELDFDAVLSREISQSRAYYACLMLEARGIPAVCRAEVIAACGDKARTSLLLQAAGVPTPRSVLALTPEAALDAAEELGYPVVAKPLTGSWGRLVTVLRDRHEAEAVLEHRAALAAPQQHIVYLQELVDKPGRDIRVLVAGDEVIGATYRYSERWRTGVACEGKSKVCPLTAQLSELALGAARAVGGGFLGVDVVEGPAGLQVLEVNHTPEFRGFAEAHGESIDVAGALVGYLLSAA
jgi:[lysine-biosynthesis-protein LysW]--L-2-aminoadipate ligase